MKKSLLFAFSLAISINSFAQCVVQTDFGDEPFGVAPDTIQNFAPAEVDVFYTQQVDVKVPVNGEFAGFPFFMVDSARIVSILGLPPGLSMTCNGNAVTECTYLGGTEGCGVISGIPTAVGTFEIDVVLEMYVQGFGALPFSFDGYRIIVTGTVGVNDAQSSGINILDARPNPANDRTTFNIQSSKNGQGTLRIFDMVGKQVYMKNVNLVNGRNRIEQNTSQLPEGIYIYRFDAFGTYQTSRLVVVH